MRNSIIIKTFNSPHEAYLLVSKLESEGITAFVLDEFSIGVNPLASVAIGGVKVGVRVEDSERALEIIQDTAKVILEDDEGNPILCPNCQSTNHYRNINSVKSVKGFLNALIAILGIYPLGRDSVYCCKECNTEFKVD